MQVLHDMPKRALSGKDDALPPARPPLGTAQAAAPHRGSTSEDGAKTFEDEQPGVVRTPSAASAASMGGASLRSAPEASRGDQHQQLNGSSSKPL